MAETANVAKLSATMACGQVLTNEPDARLPSPTWQQVKDGQLKGFSVGGTARSASSTPTPEVQ
jgi:hypothetical protein